MIGHRPGPVLLTLAGLVSVFLLLPLFAVVPVSFTPARFLSMPNGPWSMRHYQALVDNPAWLSGMLMSVRIGILSSVISTLFALAFSLGIWMYQPRFKNILVGFVLLPLIVPPVVSALTLYFLLTSISQFNHLVGYDTWPGVTLAHAVTNAPFAVVLMLVALSQVDRRIDLAARGMGATTWQRATRIILPNIKFSVVVAALMVFLLSWEEVGVTIFITSVNTITLPRLMWSGLRDNIDPAIAAISVILIILTIAVLAIIRLRERKETAA